MASSARQARAQLEKNGNLKYLATIYRGLRQTTTKKPVYTPADVYRPEAAAAQRPHVDRRLEGHGRDPIAVPLPELYDSLKTGKAEASEGDLPQIASFKLDEVQTHLIITNHLVQTGGMLINKPFFDKPVQGRPGPRRQGRQGGGRTGPTTRSRPARRPSSMDLQRKGMQVVIPDADSFRVKAKAAVEALFQKEWPVTTWQEVLAF